MNRNFYFLFLIFYFDNKPHPHIRIRCNIDMKLVLSGFFWMLHIFKLYHLWKDLYLESSFDKFDNIFLVKVVADPRSVTFDRRLKSLITKFFDYLVTLFMNILKLFLVLFMFIKPKAFCLFCNPPRNQLIPRLGKSDFFDFSLLSDSSSGFDDFDEECFFGHLLAN